MSADHAPTAPEVPGYDLGERLGQGGAGTVWAATRTSDGAPVAVKVVSVGTGEQAESLAREFAVLARVDIEGLVGFHEAIGLVGEPASVALVLDRVGGGSLESVVRARGHLSVGESVTILSPVARALAGLHSLGITHGDITPANVLVERTGRPLLADLGVASLAGEVPGQLYGTAGFVAPEVFDRGVVTSASDVYAVGALAWWCVTGEPPAPAALRRPLDGLAPGLPAAWSEITRRALLGDPEARPTAAELALTYFDSVPCEPLRLVIGGDETSLLTQRLRQSGATAPAQPVPRRRSGVVPALGDRTRQAAAFGTAMLLVVGLSLGGLMASGRIATPDWVHPQREAAARRDVTGRRMAPVRATVPPGASRGTPDLTTDRTAPQRDPRGLMVVLSTLRAAAMTSGSLVTLAELDAPGSAALAQDTAVLHDLAASGQTWEGVALNVISARDVTRTAPRVAAQSGATATVDAVVETAAYRVVDASGRTQQRPAVAGQELRFELTWVARRWRVESVAQATR